jgi:hypothetical protein
MRDHWTFFRRPAALRNEDKAIEERARNGLLKSEG